MRTSSAPLALSLLLFAPAGLGDIPAYCLDAVEAIALPVPLCSATAAALLLIAATLVGISSTVIRRRKWLRRRGSPTPHRVTT